MGHRYQRFYKMHMHYLDKTALIKIIDSEGKSRSKSQHMYGTLFRKKCWDGSGCGTDFHTLCPPFPNCQLIYALGCH